MFSSAHHPATASVVEADRCWLELCVQPRWANVTLTKLWMWWVKVDGRVDTVQIFTLSYIKLLSDRDSLSLLQQKTISCLYYACHPRACFLILVAVCSLCFLRRRKGDIITFQLMHIIKKGLHVTSTSNRKIRLAVFPIMFTESNQHLSRWMDHFDVSILYGIMIRCPQQTLNSRRHE